MKLLSFVPAGLAAISVLSLPSGRASVFTENFETYATGTGSITGYQTEPTWEVVYDGSFGAGSQVASGTSSQNNLMKGFAVTSPAVGEMIWLQFDYRYSGAPAPAVQANFVRFGLYDSGGTPLYNDDVGYHADITYYDNSSPGVTGGFYELRHEANTAPGGNFHGLLLDNQPGVITAPPPNSDGTTLAFQTKNTVDGSGVHTARLTIERTASGMDLSLFVDDMGTPKVATSTSFGTIPGDFDRFLIETPFASTGAAAFRFDNVEIGLSTVPEPEEYAAAFGVALGGFAAWRRRAKAKGVVATNGAGAS